MEASPYGRAAGYAATVAVLGTATAVRVGGPTAILAMSDELALGAYRAGGVVRPIAALLTAYWWVGADKVTFGCRRRGSNVASMTFPQVSDAPTTQTESDCVVG
ncbi:hypothetical protein [Fodinicola acaciae]|uniref:hypothetical protein n=1 Tax=Fodinicola acaciae TaxID=2681555 RepID=UPI0013D170A3|nr:hypothetical protein [Fodinicola acaciae]